MKYDYIFIGSSIPCLLSATTIPNKKILIIEKDEYFGGAWRINSDKYKNIDLVGHLIVPTNNKVGNKIIDYFKRIDLELAFIKKEHFIFETEGFKSNGKQGDSIICKNGWTDFCNKIMNYITTFENIKIIKNTEVLKITCAKNVITLNSNDKIFTM